MTITIISLWNEKAKENNERLLCTGGSYTLWMLSKFNVLEEGFFSVGVDGEMLSGEKL